MVSPEILTCALEHIGREYSSYRIFYKFSRGHYCELKWQGFNIKEVFINAYAIFSFRKPFS